MQTRTGAYLAAQRRTKHLSPQALAAAVGYTNLAKGANRILALEREGDAVDGLLDKIINVLELDHEHVHALVAEDIRLFEEAWERWVAEPVEPQLRRRMIPAVWGLAQIPKGLSRDEAIEFASARAVEKKSTYVLVWSRREEIWCYPEGGTLVQTMKVGEVAGPFTRIRGRRSRGFIFG